MWFFWRHDGKSSFFHSLAKETAPDLLPPFIIGIRRIATFMSHRSLVIRMRIEKRELCRIEENGREKNTKSGLMRELARALANFRRSAIYLSMFFHLRIYFTRTGSLRDDSAKNHADAQRCTTREMYIFHRQWRMQDPTMDPKRVDK